MNEWVGCTFSSFMPVVTGAGVMGDRALFLACAEDESAAGVRDAAVLGVGYGAGLRISEIVSLYVSDYDGETGAMRIRRAKGNKGRITYARGGARDALDHWLTLRGREAGPLFVPISQTGEVQLRPTPLTERAVFKLIQKRRRAAGVKPFSPHDLRRAYIGDLLDAGVDPSTAQDSAGHADPRTTKGYDRRGERRKRDAADLLHIPFVGRRDLFSVGEEEGLPLREQSRKLFE